MFPFLGNEKTVGRLEEKGGSNGPSLPLGERRAKEKLFNVGFQPPFVGKKPTKAG
jgi:hypothetical protein